MNYRLIYRLWKFGFGGYTSSVEAIFDDLIDVDITPLNANTDDLFSFSGRKCTIKMPYDDNAKSLFYEMIIQMRFIQIICAGSSIW